jgi:uncharacterized protein (DUF983 family)
MRKTARCKYCGEEFGSIQMLKGPLVPSVFGLLLLSLIVICMFVGLYPLA